jgi:hypothetical protein
MAHCIVCDGAFVGELQTCSSCCKLFHPRSCGEAFTGSPSSEKTTICGICAGRYSTDQLQRRHQISSTLPSIVQLRRPHFARDTNDTVSKNRVLELNKEIANLRDRISRLDLTLAQERENLDRRLAKTRKSINDFEESLEAKRDDWRRVARRLYEEKQQLEVIEGLLRDPQQHQDRSFNLERYNLCSSNIQFFRETLDRIEQEERDLSLRENYLRE